MLLGNSTEDQNFKLGFKDFATSEIIQVEKFRTYTTKFSDYNENGKAFQCFSLGDDVKAYELAKIAIQSTGDTDEHALFFLVHILDLKKTAINGDIHAYSLDAFGKWSFREALECVNFFAKDSVLEKLLIEMEVNDNLTSKFPAYRLGDYGDSRLADLLLSPKREDVLFAINQFEHLQSCHNDTYNSAYPAVKIAIKKAKNKDGDLKKRLLKIQKNIETSNPSAIIPSIAWEIVVKLRGNPDPMRVFEKEIQNWNFSPKDTCILSLNVAHTLQQLNDSNAIKILGKAATYAQNDNLLLACVAKELGDTVRAARLLFKEIEKYTENDMFSYSSRYYLAEGACRFLFKNDSVIWSAELDIAIKRFEKLGLSDIITTLECWRSNKGGFEDYIKQLTAIAKNKPFDEEELRISQRNKSNYFLLAGINGDFLDNFSTSQKWFELSVRGNDAPWIHGSRSFFAAILTSYQYFSEQDKIKQNHLMEDTKKAFENAAKLLESQDPIAISIAFMAVANSQESINANVIADLTLAMEMLDPRTPEIFELKNRLASVRWKVVEQMSTAKLDDDFYPKLWEPIARLAPLLDEVIMSDMKLDQCLFRFLKMDSLKPFQTTLDGLLSINDANARGKVLEDLMAEAVMRSPGLKLLETRHSNNYEEIDLVVLVTESSPILEQWGPVILFECKNWTDKVGTEPIGFFYSKMATKKDAVKLGIFVSPSGYTTGVKEQVARFPNYLILMFGYEELHRLIKGDINLRELIEQQIPLALLS